MVISQITTLRAHLLWQLICGRPSVGKSTPTRMAISQIATLRAHLLWQLICGRLSVGRSTPTRMAISQIATLRAHLLWQIICGRLIIGRSSIQSNDFTNSYSESSYLIPTLDRFSYVTDQVLKKSSPPYNGHFSNYYCDSSATLQAVSENVADLYPKWLLIIICQIYPY